MRLKRAIIKHTDQIHNWQGWGGVCECVCVGGGAGGACIVMMANAHPTEPRDPADT